jgi:hypothetical protein
MGGSFRFADRLPAIEDSSEASDIHQQAVNGSGHSHVWVVE